MRGKKSGSERDPLDDLKIWRQEESEVRRAGAAPRFLMCVSGKSGWHAEAENADREGGLRQRE